MGPTFVGRSGVTSEPEITASGGNKKSLPLPAGSGTANHAVAYHTLLPQTLLPKNASSVMIKPRFEIMMYFIVVPPCELLTALVKSLVVSSGYGL